MNANVVPFRYREETDIRTLLVDGEPWFVAGDVCAILDLGNVGQALAGLDDDEKDSIIISDGTPGNPNRAIVSESGLYSLVLRSRKPEARVFKRWLTSEVLPAIRKTGSYSNAYVLPQTFSEALRMLADTTEAKAASDAAIAELSPRAAAWDHMASSTSDWSVQQSAGILARDPSITIGRQRLFDFLAASHWTFRSNGHPMAYAAAIDAGWLAHRAQSHIHPRTGEVVLDPPQVRITVKGMERLHRLLGGSAPLSLDHVAELQAVGA